MIDDAFFKFVDDPNAWGFMGLLILAFIIDRFLTFRFYRSAIRKDQTDQDADNERQRDLISLIGGALERVKESLDNNTEAFKQFATSHSKLEKKVDQTNNELKETMQEVLLGITDINSSLSEIKGSNSKDSAEIRELFQQIVNKLKDMQEIPNYGNNKSADPTPVGQSSGSVGD